MRVGLYLLPMWDPAVPPLGITYVATCLRSQGHFVTVKDYSNILWKQFMATKTEGQTDLWQGGYALDWEFANDFQQKILPHVKLLLKQSAVEIIQEAEKKNLQAIGFSLFGTTAHATRYVCNIIKQQKPDLKIFVGGVDTFRSPWKKEIEIGLVDACVVGEGEISGPELIRHWEQGLNDVVIPGVMKKNSAGEMMAYVPRQIVDLKNVPIVNFDDYQLDNYKHPQIPIQMTRGCVALCSFCDEVNFWEKFRYRTPEHIYEEMKLNAEKYNRNDFLIMDSLINGHHANFKKLANMIVESGYNFSFGGNSRVDKRLTLDLLKLYKQAGCNHLTFGLESGSQKVLDLMRKGIRLEWAVDNFQYCQEVGIKVYINVLVGFPGETEEDFQQTLDFINTHIHNIDGVNTGTGMGIGPDTEVYAQPAKYGVRLNPDNSIYYGEEGWETVDGLNKHSVRQERLLRLRKMLKENNKYFTPQF